jgi:hypothetical protein
VKIHVSALAIALVAAACVSTPAAVPTTSVVQSPAQSSGTPTRSPTISVGPSAYRALAVPGGAASSPDGRWFVAQGQRDPSPLRLFTIDGVPVREFDAGRFWAWLPDSSGLFVALEVPQRAPPLAILELNGHVTTTELQLSRQTLSRDGKLIVAQQQEGCCAAIVQREVRVARRDGSGTRTLVSSSITSEPQPVFLLGVDAADRAVYRDGTNIMRIPLDGGTAVRLATSPDYAQLSAASTSPDGTAIFATGIREARSHIVANDRVTPWDYAIGSVVEDGNPFPFRSGLDPVWVGPHTLLAQDPDSRTLFTFDALTAIRTKQAAQFLPGDMVLAAQGERLLIVRSGFVVLVDLGTGFVRELGIDLRPSSEAEHGAALPTGGFIVSGPAGTFRID